MKNIFSEYIVESSDQDNGDSVLNLCSNGKNQWKQILPLKGCFLSMPNSKVSSREPTGKCLITWTQ